MVQATKTLFLAAGAFEAAGAFQAAGAQAAGLSAGMSKVSGVAAEKVSGLIALKAIEQNSVHASQQGWTITPVHSVRVSGNA